MFGLFPRRRRFWFLRFKDLSRSRHSAEDIVRLSISAFAHPKADANILEPDANIVEPISFVKDLAVKETILALGVRIADLEFDLEFGLEFDLEFDLESDLEFDLQFDLQTSSSIIGVRFADLKFDYWSSICRLGVQFAVKDLKLTVPYLKKWSFSTTR